MKLKTRLTAFSLAVSMICVYTAIPVSAADKLPVKGDKINGFTVTESRPFEPLGAELITFEHDKTGAEVLFCANDDTNRLFQISFKSPTVDDTGITHIFEHAVLGGSEKYPSQTLFMKLVNQTYNTYMNAATAQSVTSFPLSSLSEEQLLKLSDYYLDCVFNPKLYDDPSIFDREAWHYELGDSKDDLSVSGTVYSEIQGELTIQNQHTYDIRKAMFPDSYSTHMQGGLPEDILSLDNNDLIEYHKKYYLPSNSLTLLYGDLDCSSFLELLDGYFSKYGRTVSDTDFKSYTPTEKFIEASFKYPVSSSQSGGLNIYTSYAVECAGAADDPAELAKLEMVVRVWAGLVENMAEKLLAGSVVSCSLDTLTPEPLVIFTASNSDRKVGTMLKIIVEEAANQIITSGIDPELIESMTMSIKRSQAQMLDSTFGENGLEISSRWSLSDDPDYMFDLIDSIFSMDEITSDALSATLEKYTSDARSAVVTTEPEFGLADENSEALKAKLAQIKSQMSDEEINALIDKTYAYHNPETTNDELDKKLIDEISVIDAQNLPEDVRDYKITDENADGVRYLSSEVEINEMGKGRIMFDVSDVPPEDLNWLTLYISLIGAIDTEKYTSESLSVLSQRYADCSVDMVTVPDNSKNGFTPYLIFKYTGFADDSDMIFDIAEQSVLKPDWNDKSAVSSLAAQYRSLLKSSIDTNGYNLIQKHVAASSEAENAYTNAMGLTLDSDLSDVISLVESDIDSAIEKLRGIQSVLSNKSGACVIYAGSDDSIAKNRAAAKKFFSELSSQPRNTADYSGLMTKYESSALITNSSVNFNGMYAPMSLLGSNAGGGAKVALSCIYDKMIMPVLRDEFNAYSVNCAFTDGGLMILSYRDPELSNTFKFYSSLGDLISSAEITQEEVDRYILSVYSDYTKPEGELNDAYWAAADYMNGITADIKRNYMHSIKSATPETVKRFADVFRKLNDNGIRFTVGSAAAVMSSPELYDTILNPLDYDLGEIKIIVSGSAVKPDVPPYTENDRVMIPLRAIFEALGAEVEWDDAAQMVTARKDGITISLTIGANVIVVTDSYGTKEVELDSPAVIRDDRTMVPLRAVSETLGFDVRWDELTRTVYVE